MQSIDIGKYRIEQYLFDNAVFVYKNGNPVAHYSCARQLTKEELTEDLKTRITLDKKGMKCKR